MGKTGGPPLTQYEVRRGADQFGPYDQETLFNYFGEGRVVSTDEVREVGAAHWQTMQQLAQPQGMAAASMPPPGMAPPSPQVAQPLHVPSMGLAGPILVTLFCCLPFGIVSWDCEHCVCRASEGQGTRR